MGRSNYQFKDGVKQRKKRELSAVWRGVGFIILVVLAVGGYWLAERLGCRRQRMADDFHGEGIDRVLHAFSLIQRWPSASVLTTWPGGTTMVDQASSTIAGPAIVVPLGSRSRS